MFWNSPSSTLPNSRGRRRSIAVATLSEERERVFRFLRFLGDRGGISVEARSGISMEERDKPFLEICTKKAPIPPMVEMYACNLYAETAPRRVANEGVVSARCKKNANSE